MSYTWDGLLCAVFRRDAGYSGSIQRGLAIIVRKFLTVLATTCLLIGSASAGERYVSVFGGVALQEDITAIEFSPPQNSGGFSFSNGFPNPLPGSRYDFDPGYKAGAALGYSFDRLGPGYFRLEGEVSHLNAKDLSGRIESAVNYGRFDSIAGFLNATYNVGFFDERITPYLGGGIGYAAVDGYLRSQTFTAQSPVTEAIVDTGAFAVQAIAGISTPIGSFGDFFLEAQ